MEIKSLECPKCGAPIQLPEGVGATYTCIFCQNSIAVPQELRGSSEQPILNPVSNTPVIKINLGEILSKAGMPGISDTSRWRDVQQLVRNGQKIEAIKLVRELTGLGLKEAKDLVDKMEQGKTVEISRQGSPISPGHDFRTQANLEEMIRSACASGKKIEAIKILRLQTNLGLKEAKDVVEQVERGMPLQQALNLLSFGSNLNPNLDFGTRKNNPPTGDAFKSNAMHKRPQSIISCLGCVVVGILLLFGFGIPLFLWAATSFDPVTVLLQKYNPISFAKLEIQFGNEGTGPGYFTDPRAIAVDRNGSVYVADYGTGRIQRFDEFGNFQNLWNIPSNDNTSDMYIQSIGTDSDGRVYVTASGKIYVYDGSKGEVLDILTIENPNDGNSTYVDGLVITSDNRLAIVSQGENISIANRQGKVERFIPDAMSSVTKDSELSGSIAVDGLGNLYLAGAFNNAVVKYSPDGTYTTKFGGKGEEPGQLSAVLAIATDPFGQIYISDIHGISIFDTDGRFVRRFSIGSSVYGIVFDGDGNMWVTTNKSTVAKFTLSK